VASSLMTKLEGFIGRNAMACRRACWRVLNDNSPNARAVYILGAQRSGTTMLLECLEQSMDFEVLGESSKAMVNFRIKSDDYIRDTVRSSHHKFVVFKPLTDSHRARQFLDLLPNSAAIWAFRRVEDRVNSSIAKFGDHNLQVLRGLVRGEGLDKWQAQGLSPSDLEFLRQFDYSTMSPHTASALFWYLRNTLYFSQGLQDRSDVLPLAYEDLAAAPGETMRDVCRFLGAEFRPAMVSTVHSQSVGRSESRLSEETLAFCRPLYDRLHAIQKARLKDLAGAIGQDTWAGLGPNSRAPASG